MPAYDANLMFRTTGNLTQAETSAALTIRGTPIEGMAVRVSVATAFHDDDQISARVKTSDDNSTYTLQSYSLAYTGMKANPRDIIVPLVSNRKYVKLELVVTSTTAANVNFGAVTAGLTVGVGFDWSRAVAFE